MRNLLLVFALVAALSSCSTREQPGRYQMVVIQPTPVRDEVLLIMDTATGDGKLFYGKTVQSFSYEREEYSGTRNMTTIGERQ